MTFRVAALALFGLLTIATAAAGRSADFHPSSAAIRSHMRFLADDLLEGREAGTRGYDIAAAYAAARFEELGLKPAGDDGSFLQRVPLVSFRAATQGSIVLKDAHGRATPMVFGQDYVPGATPLSPKVRIEAPLVFAGFGVTRPGRDDYAGLDVKGKIVVVLSGAPASLQAEERAYYGSSRYKRVNAARRGAVGLLTVQTPTAARVYAFARLRDTWDARSMTWRTPQGAPHFPGGEATPLGTVSVEGASKLFAGAPASAEQIMAAAEAPAGEVPRFPLPQSASATLDVELGEAASSNVAALLEGSDPKLKEEVVVLSAHLDHVGVGAPVNGDRIANGAIDNAAGVAATFEAARGFAASLRRPRRSLLFLLVTAEEKGLIGAEYFAMNPTVPKSSMVANVNLDMPILTYDFTDVIAFGAERSELGPMLARAAGRLGIAVAPDPMPEQGIFVRSDHYRFVEQGVPAIFLATGFANGGKAATELFMARHYHRPSDDLSQPIDYAAAAKFARLNFEIAREIAEADKRPLWNRGDFFAGLFGGATKP